MQIFVYGDGTFHQELGLGAWAFRIPTLNLEQTGVGPGKNSGRFEILAMLHGLETALHESVDLELCGISDCPEVSELAAKLAKLAKGNGSNGAIKCSTDKLDL